MNESDNRTRLERLNAIRKTIEARQFAQALADSEAYSERYPHDIRVTFLMGHAYTGLGRVHEALEAFEQACLADPGKLEHQANWGFALIAAKQYGEAESILDAVRSKLDSIKRKQSGQKALLMRVLDGLARICIEQSRLGDALNLVEKRIQLDRDNAEGYFLRGILRLMLDSPSRAIADCEKAISIRPNDMRYHYNYGFALYMVGREDEAVQAFERFYKKDMNFAARFVYTNINAQFERTRELLLFNERLKKKQQEYGIIGHTSSMRSLFHLLNKVSDTHVAVLLQGDTGTGKELFARALHNGSPRKKGPFVPINAAALPDTLVESELFGHKKGAFTGAGQDKIGLFQMADGGTLFIDEIAEMTLLAQAKILRAIEDQEIRPLGSNSTTKVDVRLIAATKENLEKRVEEGLFRDDLFFRLDVMQFQIPGLKDRPEDIQLLAEHFIDLAVKEHNREPKYLSSDALACLQNYHWPGNVRSLKNAIERAVILAEKEAIMPEDLPKKVQGTPQKSRIIQALRRNLRPNVSAAAEEMGYSREHLTRLMNQKYKIKLSDILTEE